MRDSEAAALLAKLDTVYARIRRRSDKQWAETKQAEEDARNRIRRTQMRNGVTLVTLA